MFGNFVNSIRQMKINCICCKGTGKIDKPKKQSDLQIKINAAKTLRKAGYSIREIMNLLGYKSPQAIQYILEKE